MTFIFNLFNQRNSFKSISNVLKRIRQPNMQNAIISEEKILKKIGKPIDFKKFEYLAKDMETELKIKTVLEEYNNIIKAGKAIEQLTEKKLILLINSERKIRKIYYRKSICRISLSKQKEKRKCLIRQNMQMKKEELNNLNSKLIYSLHRNALFLRIRKLSINRFHNFRLCKEIIFGQPLVFDFGYDKHMNFVEVYKGVYEIVTSCVQNFNAIHPFNIHICNAKESSLSTKLMKDIFKNFDSSNCLYTITEKSYLECFSKNKLIYLSPNADVVLKEFDPTAVYIIGCLVDPKTKPLSIQKAKSENIRSMRLDIDVNGLDKSGYIKLLMIEVFNYMLYIKENEMKAFTLKNKNPLDEPSGIFTKLMKFKLSDLVRWKFLNWK